MMKTIRPRGVLLTLLDVGKVEADAVTVLREQGQDVTEVRCGFPPYAMALHDGKMFVICGEGVGWEVADGDPLVLPLYKHEDGHISLQPSFDARLSQGEVVAIATGAEVDLADLIRAFGSRLETNHALWYKTLGGALRG